MKKILNSIKTAPFIRPLIGLTLAACLPIIQVYVFNAHELTLPDILIPLAINLSGLLICFCIVFLIFRSLLKTELICYVGITFVWLYSSYHSFINDTVLGFFGLSLDFTNGTKLAMLLWLSLSALCCLYIYKRAHTLIPLAKSIPFVMLLFYGELAFNIYAEDSTFIGQEIDENLPEDLSKALSTVPTESSTEQLPDIYFIILDAYARQDFLQKQYNFDNSPFIEELKKLGFIVPDNSHSNYVQTLLSLPATLNLHYINDLGLKGKNMKIMYRMIQKESFAVKFLRHQGYKIVSLYDPAWTRTKLDKADFFTITTQSFFLVNSELALILLQKTIFEPFLRKFNLILLNLAQSKFDVLNSLKNVHKIQGRKFIFMHILSPHVPYIFDKDGQISTDLSFDVNIEQDMERYIGQLQFLNKKILPILQEIITQSPVKPIIFLQSDHGSRWELSKTLENKKANESFSNLNAVYMQGEKLTDIPTTPVNNFRYIFKKYFNMPIELLPNRMYFSTPVEPYKFFDVSDMLLQGDDIYIKDLLSKKNNNDVQ